MFVALTADTLTSFFLGQAHMEAAASEAQPPRLLLGPQVCEGVSFKGQSSELVNCALSGLPDDEACSCLVFKDADCSQVPFEPQRRKRVGAVAS